jgi:vacuolar-type H+-ATPase subunit E/Vma4
MGLDRMIGEVRRRGDEAAAEILGQAQSEAQGIVEAAKARAKAKVEASQSQAAIEAGKARLEGLSKAKNASAKTVGKARAQHVEQHLDAVWSGILALRGTERYGRLIAKLAQAAYSELGPGSRLYCRREDAAYMGAYKPAGYIECAGGVLAEDASGRVRVDARLETIFASCRERLAAKAYARLFPGDR